MRAYYEYSSRSDKVLAEHLDSIELIPYEEAAIVLCIGDRLEIFELAWRAFKDHKYIIHYYAGVVQEYITTYDDIIRHCITLMSNEQWVESKRCKRNVKRLLKAINKQPNVRVVGANHLLGVDLDYSKVPKEPYNLILYNPTTTTKEVFISPNPDIKYGTLPQEQLLGLIKKCTRFLTNSSAGVYEAPFLIEKDQIVWLGKRNCKRRYKL